jgi:hypothetical protein
VEKTIAVKYAVGILAFIRQEGGTLALTPKGNLKRDHVTAGISSEKFPNMQRSLSGLFRLQREGSKVITVQSF